jgi:hypothetical protein
MKKFMTLLTIVCLAGFVTGCAGESDDSTTVKKGSSAPMPGKMGAPEKGADAKQPNMKEADAKATDDKATDDKGADDKKSGDK